MASCPGGVASNVVTFLARADVPLSVAMTTVSTLTAIVATPALAKLLVGKLVPVDAGSLLLSTLQASLQLVRHTLAPRWGGMLQLVLPQSSCLKVMRWKGRVKILELPAPASGFPPWANKLKGFLGMDTGRLLWSSLNPWHAYTHERAEASVRPCCLPV